MSPRRLTIIDINDQPTSGEGEKCRWFRLVQITRFMDVQGYHSVERRRGGGPRRGRTSAVRPDIVVADVSFDRDASLERAALPSTSRDARPIVPVGPILALPFMGRRNVVAFGTYSGNWNSVELRSFPWFALPMALIAHSLTGKRYYSRALVEPSSVFIPKDWASLEDDWLRHVMNVEKFENAIEEALRQYRKTLKASVKSGRVTLLNDFQVSRLLKALAKDATRTRRAVELPENASLKLLGPHGKDDISLRSLFADYVGWSSSVVQPRDVEGLGEEWEEIVGTEKHDIVFRHAMDTLAQLNASRERSGPGLGRTRSDARRLLAEKLVGRSVEFQKKVLRLVVLLANVFCWDPAKAKVTAKKVHDWVARERNTYWGWFGERSHGTPWLSPITPTASGKESYYLQVTTVLSPLDRRRVLKFLRAERLPQDAPWCEAPPAPVPGGPPTPAPGAAA